MAQISEDWGIRSERIWYCAYSGNFVINDIVELNIWVREFHPRHSHQDIDTEQAMFLARYKEELTSRLIAIRQWILGTVWSLVIILIAIGIAIYGIMWVLKCLPLIAILCFSIGFFHVLPPMKEDLAAILSPWIFSKWRARPNGWWQRRLMKYLIS